MSTSVGEFKGKKESEITEKYIRMVNPGMIRMNLRTIEKDGQL